MIKEITTSIIAVIIVLGFIAGLFYPVNDVVAKVLFTLVGIVVGFYFGSKTVPFGAFIKRS